MSYSAPYPGREWELTAHYLATGQLNCDDGVFDKILPMSEANEAFALYKTPGAVKGKLMLVNED
jgi:L-iditol 2-dehydrogenase